MNIPKKLTPALREAGITTTDLRLLHRLDNVLYAIEIMVGASYSRNQSMYGWDLYEHQRKIFLRYCNTRDQILEDLFSPRTPPVKRKLEFMV